MITLKLNGFEYTKEEILEALKKKGYRIVPHTFHDEEHIHGSTFIKHHYTAECALLLPTQSPDETNQWHKVAMKEFEKPKEKPPLV